MAISDFHASHIRRVRVTFTVSAPELDPTEVTRRMGLTPSQSNRRGEERRHPRSGATLEPYLVGCWTVSSTPAIDSKDVNDHFRWLLDRLLPGQAVILPLATEGETYFDVLWESTYLYAGTGPLLDAECLAGVAALNAGMGFDIYQVDETSTE
ncbi:DUF4279 domain-containing protein [Limnoglobus roseus]|uniref:DUF4279 domain-containing protein n=1 Tax=Limnoglobus roseus TaxID=2598579 RepID=A0A5C1AA86_9BACT|nr:DUF4279 domain-containing protein [Limnoglobus roseus]QEL15117.1 hypothetical protein PX52LOC_02026 [Limnoglobus roseus]